MAVNYNSPTTGRRVGDSTPAVTMTQREPLTVTETDSKQNLGKERYGSLLGAFNLIAAASAPARTLDLGRFH